MKSVYDVIQKPIVSETSMDDAENRKYTFLVATDANKTEVKHAVEEVFGVEVEKVNIMNKRGKMKRMGSTQGRRPNTKKAIITLKPGSKTIEFFEGL